MAAIDRADRLAKKAVKGFNRAHAKLNKANDLLDAEEAQRLADAESWRLEMERAIAEALREKNAKKINILSDLIA